MIEIQNIFGPVDREIQQKLADALSGPARIEAEFRRALGSRLSPADAAQVDRDLAFARTLRSKTAAHPSFGVYLSHPIRVAMRVLQSEPRISLELLQIALLHNFYELTGQDEAALLPNGYSTQQAQAIRLLTIDRSKETDPGYLAEFYGAIERHSPGLSLVRCHDKLDNIFELELIPDEGVRKSYLDLAERFVVPMATRLFPDFGRYFQDVIGTMRRRPFQPELRRRYDAFIAQHRQEAASR